MSKDFKLYLAGSLFTEKDRMTRDLELCMLKEEFGEEVEVYSPMHNDEINDKSKEVTPEDIFNQDTEKVLESDFITASLEEVETDPGVAVELGVAMGVNAVLTTLLRLEEKLYEKGINDMSALTDSIFAIIPPKKICANYSDIRLTHNNKLAGIYKDMGLNQYVVGGLLSDERHTISQGFVNSIEEIKKEIELFKEFDKVWEELEDLNKEEE